MINNLFLWIERIFPWPSLIQDTLWSRFWREAYIQVRIRSWRAEDGKEG